SRYMLRRIRPRNRPHLCAPIPSRRVGRAQASLTVGGWVSLRSTRPLYSNPAIESASEQSPYRALVERDRIAASRRIVRGHGDDALDVAIVHLQARKRMRDADLRAQRQHEVAESAKARLETEIGGKALDPVFDGLAIEHEHIRHKHRIGEAVMSIV